MEPSCNGCTFKMGCSNGCNSTAGKTRRSPKSSVRLEVRIDSSIAPTSDGCLTTRERPAELQDLLLQEHGQSENQNEGCDPQT